MHQDYDQTGTGREPSADIKPATWTPTLGDYTTSTDEGSYRIFRSSYGDGTWWAINESVHTHHRHRLTCSGQQTIADAQACVDYQRAEIAAARISDVGQAHDLAIVEYVNRNLVARGADPIDDRGPAVAAILDSFQRDAVAEMVGPAVTVSHAATADFPSDFELETRVRNAIFEHTQGNISRRAVARQIIRLVRESSPPASHEGATVSAALTAERFGPVGGDR